MKIAPKGKHPWSSIQLAILVPYKDLYYTLLVNWAFAKPFVLYQTFGYAMPGLQRLTDPYITYILLKKQTKKKTKAR